MNHSKCGKFNFPGLSLSSFLGKYDNAENPVATSANNSELSSNVASDSNPLDAKFPAGHPAKFLQALSQYPVTKTFARYPEQISCLLKRTPIFLVETRAHNALWLSRLKSTTVHWFANRNSQSDKPPPRVVRGLDMGNLKTVIPNSFINCQVGDIWYYQLQETDILYDISNFTRPEEVLYKWFTKDIASLESLKTSFLSSGSLDKDAQTAGTNKLNEEYTSSAKELEKPISESSVACCKNSGLSVKSANKTTPFWAQVNLFATQRRRRRVTVDPRRRLSGTNIFQWAQIYGKTLPRTSFIDITANITNCGNELDESGAQKRTKHGSQPQSENERPKRQCDNPNENCHQVMRLTCKRVSCENSTNDDKNLSNCIVSTINIDQLSESSISEEATSVPPLTSVPPTSTADAITDTTMKYAVDTNQESPHPAVDSTLLDEAKNSTTDVTLPLVHASAEDDDDVERDQRTKKLNSSKGSKHTSALRQLIRSIQKESARQFKPGDWVPVRIYATNSVYDIKWIDGSVSKGLTCDKIVAFGGYSEHYIFPGYLVSLKNDKSYCSQPIPVNSPASEPSVPTETMEKLGVPSRIIDPTCSHPRDLGIALSYNAKDRTCLVQWFTIGANKTGPKSLIPLSSPEEISVYEIAKSGEYQTHYGDIVLIKSEGDDDYSIYPAGFLEDIIPESGTLLVRWIDGTSSEVYRTDCWQAIESEDDSTDEEDSIDSDFSDSDFDVEEKWESYSTSSYSDSSELSSSSDDTDSVVVQLVQLTYEEDLHPVAAKLLLASQHITSAQRLFSDRFTFVLWLMRCFATIPGVADDILEQIYSTLRSAALVDPEEVSAINLDCSLLELTNVQGGDSVKTPSKTFSLSEKETAWSHVDEVEAVSSVEMLNTGRSLLHKAFQQITDYRIQKMFRQCDFRSNVFEKHIGEILRLFESFPLSTTSSELNTNITDSNKLIKEEGHTRTQAPNPIYRNPLNHCTSDLVESFSRNVGSKTNCNMVVNATIIIKLAKFLHALQKNILEQLSDLNNQIVAWLHECAPQCLLQTDSNDYIPVTKSDDERTANIPDSIDSCKTETKGDSNHANGAENGSSEYEANIMSSPSLIISNSSNEVKEDSVIMDASSENVDQNILERSVSEIECKPNETLSSNFPMTPVLCTASVESLPSGQGGQFIMEPMAPSTHRFFKSSQKNLPSAFHKALKTTPVTSCIHNGKSKCLLLRYFCYFMQISLLSTILPNDIIIKAFEDRIDLYSIMIIGASGTPYEHCLFFFDIGLPSSYPTTPPQVHYYSFGNERVNPNLYINGHICLSLLGTWSGQGTENWSAETSNLLQLLISIQGLILNSEPYFNEAGYEEQRSNPAFQEQSRIYNEAVVALNLQSMISILQNPFPIFRKEIIKHCVDKYKE
ncbi:unnamed protein product [Heterobilharzia americana]|nr:unnamed protein product [Heterobilharzia americana]